jgi:hypothetical protein
MKVENERINEKNYLFINFDNSSSIYQELRKLNKKIGFYYYFLLNYDIFYVD